MLNIDESIDLYSEFDRLIEENKLNSKYAEITNIIILIICFTIYCILPQFISIIDSVSIICLFYLISKLLNFMMFGSRGKRIKQKKLIKNYLNSLK